MVMSEQRGRRSLPGQENVPVGSNVKIGNLSTSQAVVMDHMQSKFMEFFFRDLIQQELPAQKNGRDSQFAIKGGKSMQALGILNRYTKDIDMSASPDVRYDEIHKRVDRAMQHIASLGFVKDVTYGPKYQSQRDSSNPKWIIKGKYVNGGSDFSMQVEVSRRDVISDFLAKKIDVEAVNFTNGKPYSFQAYSYTPLAMAAVKTASFSGKMLRPRDLLDLYELIVTVKVDPPVGLLSSLGKDKLTEMIYHMETNLSTLTLEKFEQDVMSFIQDQNLIAKMTQDHFEEMRIQVMESLNQWLNAAKDIADDVIDIDDARKNKNRVEFCYRQGIAYNEASRLIDDSYKQYRKLLIEGDHAEAFRIMDEQIAVFTPLVDSVGEIDIKREAKLGLFNMMKQDIQLKTSEENIRDLVRVAHDQMTSSIEDKKPKRSL